MLQRPSQRVPGEAERPSKGRRVLVVTAHYQCSSCHEYLGDNGAAIRAAELTLSVGSTVATESIVHGVPHAFVQLGWHASDAFLDANYAWLAVPRISVADGASDALAALVTADSSAAAAPLSQMRRALEESAMGSEERAWSALRALAGGEDGEGAP